MLKVTKTAITSRFRKNTLNGGQRAKVEELRKAFEVLGHKMVENCPKGRCLALAVTELEDAFSWAKSSIFRNAS